MEKISVEDEEFEVPMKDIHQQVKEGLQKSVEKYKQHADLKKRDV